MIINTVDRFKREIVETEALVCRDGFALSPNGFGLAVNHVKSGIAIFSVWNRESGEKAIDFLATVQAPGGVKLADMPGCEICANVLWLQPILLNAIDEYGIDANISRTKTNAADIADIIECAVSA